MQKIKGVIWFLFMLYCASTALSAQTSNIIINEFLASNAHVNYDPDYRNYSDWIELFNNENYSISLGGYYITDDLDEPYKYSIPAGIEIAPKGHLLLFADGEQNGIHLNFQLSQEGEQIGLFNPVGMVVDTVSFGEQVTDISFARDPSNTSVWLFNADPTPCSENSPGGFVANTTTATPVFSHESGFYSVSLFLELSADDYAEIRYTLDGSEPSKNSNLYYESINIVDRSGEPNYFSNIPTNNQVETSFKMWEPPNEIVNKATVVRARAFSNNELPSDIVTKTYFIGSDLASSYSSIPVISLISNEKHFFSDSTGIYVPGETRAYEEYRENYFHDWDRPAHVEYFDESGVLQFSQGAEIAIQGSTSQLNPQKGLHIKSNKKFGYISFDYPLFSTSASSANDIISSKRFILRAWGYPSWHRGMVNDALAQTHYAESSLAIQDYKPIVLFINGEYWGLHELREANKNPYYFQEHYGVDPDNPGIDLLVGSLNNYTIDEGDDIHWQNLIGFIETNDLSVEENYNFLKTQIDIDNFIDYVGHCVFFGKTDWPEQNEAFWRPRTLGGKWKWIQYDMDSAITINSYNMFDHIILGSSVLTFGKNDRPPHALFLRLIQNNDFKYQFINWFLDRIYSDFKTDILRTRFDAMLNELYPHLEEHQSRWPGSGEGLNAATQFIRRFYVERADTLISHIKKTFNLGELESITVDRSDEGGYVKINSLLINNDVVEIGEMPYPWKGKYFEDIPITITSFASQGYYFDHWEGTVNSNSNSIMVYPSGGDIFKAVFKPLASIDSLYINEIYSAVHNGSGDEDIPWLELFNFSKDSINLSSLYLTDSSDPTKWEIAKIANMPSYLGSQEFLVIHLDSLFAQSSKAIINQNNSLALYQISGKDTTLLDSISYSALTKNISYGRYPDGEDNLVQMLNPTPGTSNLYEPSPAEINNKSALLQNYPNPSQDFTNIIAYLIDDNKYYIKIFDINGNLVRKIPLVQSNGYQVVLWDGKDLNDKKTPSGIYLYTLWSHKLLHTKKLLRIK